LSTGGGRAQFLAGGLSAETSRGPCGEGVLSAVTGCGVHPEEALYEVTAAVPFLKRTCHGGQVSAHPSEGFCPGGQGFSKRERAFVRRGGGLGVGAGGLALLARRLSSRARLSDRWPPLALVRAMDQTFRALGALPGGADSCQRQHAAPAPECDETQGQGYASSPGALSPQKSQAHKVLASVSREARAWE
jgi:hypothetical protein